MEIKILIINWLHHFSTSPPGFHILLSPPERRVWEAVLRGRSYPRLSPRVWPCAGCDFTKKTSAPLIPGLPICFPQVIPEFFSARIVVWKSAWKSGGITPEKGLSNWRDSSVFHQWGKQMVLGGREWFGNRAIRVEHTPNCFSRKGHRRLSRELSSPRVTGLQNSRTRTRRVHATGRFPLKLNGLHYIEAGTNLNGLSKKENGLGGQLQVGVAAAPVAVAVGIDEGAQVV